MNDGDREKTSLMRKITVGKGAYNASRLQSTLFLYDFLFILVVSMCLNMNLDKSWPLNGDRRQSSTRVQPRGVLNLASAGADSFSQF